MKAVSKYIFCAIFLAAATSVISAEPVIDFSGGGGGPITTNGQVGGVITGTNIEIDWARGFDTPSCGVCSTLTVNHGILNFTSGVITSVTSGTFNFADGGTFSILGGIGALGIPDGSVLLQGSFGEGYFDNETYSGMFAAQGTGSINTVLADNFGLGPDDFSLRGVNLTGGSLRYNGSTGLFQSTVVTSTDYSNAYVPEPESVVLLGSSLLLIGFALRRRLAVQ